MLCRLMGKKSVFDGGWRRVVKSGRERREVVATSCMVQVSRLSLFFSRVYEGKTSTEVVGVEDWLRVLKTTLAAGVPWKPWDDRPGMGGMGGGWKIEQRQ
jgi:hypothetical protein